MRSLKKIRFSVVFISCFSTTCRTLDQNASQELTATQELTFVDQSLSPLETHSEDMFRNLLAWHMTKEGYNMEAVQQAIYRTPASMKQVPVTRDPNEFLNAMTGKLVQEKPSAWYLAGAKDPPKPRAPRTPKKPATIIVIPGIFGEFIKNYPFHEIVTDTSSSYHQKWKPALSGVQDEVFSVMTLKTRSIPLYDVIKFGSYDMEGRPWVQVLLLEAKIGSLETLGDLQSNIVHYKRRLDKFFSLVKDDTDLYVMGYSRGTPVALELIRQVKAPDSPHPWGRRIKGIIGLGGVFYGTKIADEALQSSASPNGKMLGILRQLSNDLKVDEEALQGKVTLRSASYMAQNTALWAKALKDLAALQIWGTKDSQTSQGGDPTQGFFSIEKKLRSQEGPLQKPDLFGLVELVQDFAFDLLKRDCALACYFNNVATFKLLLTRVFEGVETLTVSSRLKWWEQYGLPPDLRIFSITGTMPDATRESTLSPLFSNPYYGAPMVDFNIMLRGSFYGILASEKAELNDSQVTFVRSRYWPSIFSNRVHKHYFLGALGTHHWGFSFPFAIKNANLQPNPFPRSALMAAIGSFIEEVNAQVTKP